MSCSIDKVLVIIYDHNGGWDQNWGIVWACVRTKYMYEPTDAFIDDYEEMIFIEDAYVIHIT